MQPYQAVKAYRCPGCDHEIPPGLGHEVVVPRDAPEERRHWHTGCWRRVESRRWDALGHAEPRALERALDHVDRRRGAAHGQHRCDVEAQRAGARARDARRASAWPSVRNRRCLANVTASAGVPKAVLRRVFTSQNTSTCPAPDDEVELTLAAAPVAVEHVGSPRRRTSAPPGPHRRRRARRRDPGGWAAATLRRPGRVPRC